MDLWLDTENRLVLTPLHRDRPSSLGTSGFFPAPPEPEVTRRYDQVLSRAEDPASIAPECPLPGASGKNVKRLLSGAAGPEKLEVQPTRA